MSNNNDFENRMHFMLKNNNGKPFSEKKYPKGQHVGFLNEEFGNYSTECDKLIVYQRNLIQQQQCLIDILSVKLGKCEKSDSEEQDLNLSKQKQIIRIFVSISFALLVTIGVVVLILHYTNSALKDNSDFTTTVPSSKDNENLGTHQVLDRTQWNGRAALSVENMTSPVPIVIIKHTGGGPCLTFQECAGKVQTIQSNSVTDGLSDIRYSFLIGGDGNIYVGRGWNVQPAQIPDTIDIAFMGSFSFDLLSDTMIEAAQLLLKDGVEREKLDKEYKLVSHNQTTSTESPGKNVYELITKWPHYDGQLKIGKDLDGGKKD
ncbi:peptidoglycan-recognition protein SA-like isoform X2 [Anoplophora glabripennis]|uniref:peptidoglycan-recognition protein SA-like isoform X2 n=1 Tax=Anoplophora glabripennis TaxID=217634 RepID=UPI0008758780|nr:peptidoglycan-recognition protein SA-like isoform X2 [Anoplophora glabripennis]